MHPELHPRPRVLDSGHQWNSSTAEAPRARPSSTRDCSERSPGFVHQRLFYGLRPSFTVTKDTTAIRDQSPLKTAILGASWTTYVRRAPLLAPGSVESDEAAPTEQDEFFNRGRARDGPTSKDLSNQGAPRR